jgi:hypothetical protein
MSQAFKLRAPAAFGYFEQSRDRQGSRIAWRDVFSVQISSQEALSQDFCLYS